jgi:hypothetical protein
MLGQQQCSILLPLHHKLVQIKDLMMNQHETEMQTVSNRSTPIPHNNNNNICLNYNSTSFLIDNCNSTTKLSTNMNHLV